MNFRFSPSSQETEALCTRRWWFSKVLKLPEEADDTLAWGTAVHLVLENYLRDGTILKPGVYRDSRDTVTVTDDHVLRARASFPKLPKPGTWRVELWVPQMEIVPGLRVAAKIDAYNVEEVAILDHKSTGTIKTDGKWGKNSANLSTNPQGLFYAGALQRTGVLPAGRPVKFYHNYVQRDGAVRSHLVDTVFEPDRIDSAWERSQASARRMQELAKTVPASLDAQDAVPYNRQGCRAFNRPCPFAASCRAFDKPTITNLARSLDAAREPQEATLSVFSKLRKAPTATPQADSTASKVTSPNAVGVDANTVRPAFLAEIVAECRILRDECGDITLEDIQRIAREEHLPGPFHANVAAALGLTGPGIPDAGHPQLLAGWPYTAEALLGGAGADAVDTAQAVAEAASAVLGVTDTDTLTEVVSDLPAEVLDAAVEQATPEQAAVINQARQVPDGAAAILEGELGRDAHRLAAAKAVYENLVTGVAQRATESEIDAALRAAGAQRVRTTAITAVLEALAKIPNVEVVGGTARIRGSEAPQPPAPPKPVAPTPKAAPTNPAPKEAPPKSEEDDAIPADALQDLSAAKPDEVAAPFVLCVGVHPRGAPYVDFYDIPQVKEAVRTVADTIEAETGVSWRLYDKFVSAYQRFTVELDRLIARDGRLQAEGYAILSAQDPWAHERAGLLRMLTDNGYVVLA